MKKIFAAALAAIVLAATLTGCGDSASNNNSSSVPADNSTTNNSSANESSAGGDNSSTDNTSSDNTSSNAPSGTGAAEQLEAAAQAYLNNVQTNPDLAFYPMQQASAEGAVAGKTADGYLYVIVHENGEEIAKVLSDPSYKLPDPDPEVDNSGVEYPDNKAGELARRVLNTNWAFMNAISDQDMINMLFSEDFKLDLCEEYFFASSMMSTQLLKVIIIKPKA